MAYTKQAQLSLQNLPKQAKNAEIFHTLHSGLISIGKLCDDECIVAFDKHKLVIR